MNKNKLNLTLPLVITFILMVLVVIYTSASFYRISVSNIYEAGEDKISTLSASLGNYLDTAKSVLWVTADSVDYMISNGESNEKILDYLKQETSRHKSQFDENYTGLYGYISGYYLDGLGWEPPEDYIPTQRDWYRIASEAGGKLCIVPPYVDAQTGSVVISVCKNLSDRANVLSLDVYTNHIQDIISATELNGKGYGFIVDKNGTLVAHPDTSLNGTNLLTQGEGERLMKSLSTPGNERFETEIGGRKCTVFADAVMDQWYVVLVVGNDELFRDMYIQLALNVVTDTIVFALIALFYYIAYRNEQKSSREAEALKISEQQKAYEAEILRLEKSAADSANKAKGDFLAQMSHEIRTPINAVLGMNEMILSECEDDTILEYAGNIKTAGRTLLSLINSILDFSKIEDGKMEIIPVRYDTVLLINNLVNSVSERARDKGLRFTVNADPELPCSLVGDDVRVTQIIMNLLTNAVKYTERGSVTLDIKCAERTKKEVTIAVSVSDTGIGIREEDIGRLAESFSRLDETRNLHIEGTGLGMAIVTRLLELMGSKLDVRSVYGEGSVFSFEIKQKISNPAPIGEALERREERSKRVKKEYKCYAGAKVLVTDDNDMNLKVAKNLLKLFSIEPVLVTSGAETIELMRKNRYDIVLLDHMMPKMDGIETLEKLKEENLIPEGTVVIALTANAVIGAKEKYLEAGFMDYIPKPIELDLLEEKLAMYLKESEKAPAPDTNAPKDGGDGKALLKKLDALGFSSESGFGYCMEDIDFYREMLTEYARSYEERAAELDKAYEEKDMKLYCTIVHGLKSASKTVGADDVSDFALSLEKASRDEKLEYIEENHDKFRELFRLRTSQTASLLNIG